MAERDTTEAKKVLLEQAKALDMKVDRRWDVDTLALKVLEAQEAKDLADKAAFADDKNKVWVVLQRDAWPVADEKHLAGETIQVPQAIADYWYSTGGARPGKAPIK